MYNLKMGIQSKHALFEGNSGFAEVTTSGLDGLVVGADSPFIILMRTLRQRTKSQFPHPDSIYLEDFFDPRIGRKLTGLVHVVDVTADDPENFWFTAYGARAAFGEGADFSARPLSEIPSESIRQMAQDNYLRAKHERVTLVSDVNAKDKLFLSRYRRLIVPLSNNMSDVSHLLIAISRQTFEVSEELPYN